MSLDPVLSAKEIEEFISGVFPAAARFAEIVSFAEGELRVRVRPDESGFFLRPGGTVSGPAMMTLADLALYYITLGYIGRVELAVTTQLNISFLRKPAPGNLVGIARLLKLGKRLAVGEVRIESESAPGDAVAHAQVTYSIPPHGKHGRASA